MALNPNRSGQVTVTTAGTAVQGPDCPGSQFFIKAHPSNTNPVWIGNVAGDVDNTNGVGMAAANPGVVVHVTNLSQLWFDATTNGEKICWLRIK